MKCAKCNFEVNQTMKFCPNCGGQIEKINKFKKLILKIKNILLKYPKIFLLCIVIVILLFIVIIVLKNSAGLKTLNNINLNSVLKFTIGNEQFYLGEKISKYKEKGIVYEDAYLDDDAYVIGNSISLQSFYKEDNPQFFATLHCPSKDNCKYEDANIIKINFYDSADVIIDDYIKFNMTYEDVVKKYGKEKGVFYQDESYLVWTIGETGKIGESYFILRFSDNLFSKRVTDIRIGVWWYEGEFDHTVKEANNAEV